MVDFGRGKRVSPKIVICSPDSGPPVNIVIRSIRFGSFSCSVSFGASQIDCIGLIATEGFAPNQFRRKPDRPSRPFRIHKTAFRQEKDFSHRRIDWVSNCLQVEAGRLCHLGVVEADDREFVRIPDSESCPCRSQKVRSHFGAAAENRIGMPGSPERVQPGFVTFVRTEVGPPDLNSSLPQAFVSIRLDPKQALHRSAADTPIGICRVG